MSEDIEQNEKVLGGDWDRSMKQYVDNYRDLGAKFHAKGIIQEIVFQNVVDAINNSTLNIGSVSVVVDDPEGCLIIRDEGTTGMCDCERCDWGALPGGGECQICPWGSFHFMAAAQKEGKLGDRGMGKSLLLQAGKRVIVRTKIATKDGSHRAMASEFQRNKQGLWVYIKRAELAPNEQENIGTEIKVFDVDAGLLDDLKCFDELRDTYVIPSWWPVIEQGFSLKYRVKGLKTWKLKSGYKWPKTAQSKYKTKTSKKTIPLKIKQNRKYVQLGHMKNLQIALAEEPVPEEIRGIALIKKGTQVIEYFTEWGRKIPPDFQDRIYGWVILDTQLSKTLQEFERPSHIGYNHYPPEVKALTNKVKEFTHKLLKPHLKELESNEEKYSPKEKKLLQNVQDVINQALQDIPEFNPWNDPEGQSQPGGDDGDTGEPYQRTIPYCYIKLDKKHYNSGDTCSVSVTVHNPDPDYQRFLSMTIEALNRNHEVINSRHLEAHEIGVVPPANGENGKLTIPDWSFIIDNEFNTGKNWVRVKLSNTNRAVEHGQRITTQIENKKVALWIDTEPPEKSREPRGGNSGIGALTVHFGPNQIDDGTYKDVLIDLDDRSADIDPHNGPRLKQTWGKPIAMTHIYSGVAEELFEIMLIIKCSDDDDIVDNRVDLTKVVQISQELMLSMQMFLSSCAKIS